jgi:predicted transcriptional regulator
MPKKIAHAAGAPDHALSRRERQIMDTIHQRGEASVAEVVAALSGRPAYSTVRAQLRVLEESGMVRTQKRGRVRECRLVPKALDEVANWVGARKRSWQRRLDALDHFLDPLEEER